MLAAEEARVQMSARTAGLLVCPQRGLAETGAVWQEATEGLRLHRALVVVLGRLLVPVEAATHPLVSVELGAQAVEQVVLWLGHMLRLGVKGPGLVAAVEGGSMAAALGIAIVAVAVVPHGHLPPLSHPAREHPPERRQLALFRW